jgi:NodT family efflux transporter outer membrane factor (OMF) lipoprotein
MKISTLLLVALLAGCTVGPNYRKPDIAVPTSYQGVPTSKDLAPLSVPTSSQADLSHWWMQFHDPELQTLISRALKSNLDLLAAASRVREAREQEIIAGAAALPHISAAGTAVNLHSNSDMFSSVAAGGSSGVTMPGSTNIRLYSLGFDATWEVDLFGGMRRGAEAAKASTQATLWQMRDGEVSLTAEIAEDYITLRATQARIAILRSEAQHQNAVLDLTRARARAGFVTQLDVNQQRTLVTQTLAQVPELQAQVGAMEHAIAVLLGEQPEATMQELDGSIALPTIPPKLPVGLPSELLRRRPDIREAERRLATATANIGVAVADLYPKLNLIGLLSMSSNGLGGLVSTNNLGEIGVGSIMWPLFEGGKTHANIRTKKEQAKQAYYAYQKAVLGALRDTEDALARYMTEQQRLMELRRAVQSATSSAMIAEQQYRAGLVTYVNVLMAQSNELSARNQLMQSQQALETNLVSLYKALGGGWQNE